MSVSSQETSPSLENPQVQDAAEEVQGAARPVSARLSSILNIHKELRSSFGSSSSGNNAKQKPPTKPKRPANAYALFVQAECKSVKENFPDLPHKEVIKIMGEAWRNASDEDKAPYRKDGEAKMQLYQAAIKLWNESKPKAAAAAAATSKRSAAAASFGAEKHVVVQKPKATAKRKPDGTFVRPRGAAPQGLTWDPARGIWASYVRKNAPTTTTATARNSGIDSGAPRSPKRKKPPSRLRAPHVSPLANQTALLQLPPSSPPVKKPDGKFAKPRGPAPGGRFWDEVHGLWVSEQTIDTKKPSGPYKRPQGRARSGMTWDSHTGVWVPSIQSRATEKAAKRDKAASSDAFETLGMPTRAFLQEEGIATAEQFLAQDIVNLGVAFTEWRATKGMPPLRHESSGKSNVMNWRTRVRKAMAKMDEPTGSPLKKRRSSGPRKSTKSAISGGAMVSDLVRASIDPMDSLHGPARAFLGEHGIETSAQLLARDTTELAVVYTQWRAANGMPSLKHENSAKNNISTWQSLVRKAIRTTTSGTGTSRTSPRKKRGRPRAALKDSRKSTDNLQAPWPLGESQPMTRRVKSPGTSKYVACGTCKGCRCAQNCGTCLPCRNHIDSLAGPTESKCAKRICIAAVRRHPVARVAAANPVAKVAPAATVAKATALTQGDVSARAPSTPLESVVESLSDQASLSDDMSDLESTVPPNPSARRGSLAMSDLGSPMTDAKAARLLVDQAENKDAALSAVDFSRRLQSAERVEKKKDDDAVSE